MTHKGTRVLISYNYPAQNDRVLAERLARYLHDQMQMNAVPRDYNQSTLDTEPAYEWLILVHSPEALHLEERLVSTALQRVLRRDMRGILAVTSGTSELPSEWATIRKYDASDENRTLRSIAHDMQYVKAPYTPQPNGGQIPLVGSRMPQVTAPRLMSVMLVLLACLILALGGGTTFYILEHNTHTALSPTPQKTQVAAPSPGTLLQQQQYDAITKKTPDVRDFSDNEQWDLNAPCTRDATKKTYTVNIVTLSQYTRCMAQKIFPKYFAYQVTMKINGDAGGVIFRAHSDNTGSTFYRISINTASFLTAYLCQPEQCNNDNHVVDEGKSLLPQITQSVGINSTQPITLTVIAKDKSIDIYVDGKYTGVSLPDNSPTEGQIGVYAADVHTPTTVSFTDLKVWSLTPPPTPPPTKVPSPAQSNSVH